VLVLIALWAAIFVVYLATGIGTSGDSRWSLPIAVSILHEGNTNLDEFHPLADRDAASSVETVRGHQYSYFPIGVSIVALPFVWLFDWMVALIHAFMPAAEDWLRGKSADPLQPLSVLTFYWRVEQVIASCVTAGTAVIVFAIARRTLEVVDAIVAAMVFAFATSAWSIGSTALWQHGPSMFLLALTLLLLIRAEERPALAQFAAIPLAFAYVVRPTNSVPILMFTAYVFLRHRRYALQYLLWAAPIAAAFVAYNIHLYGAVLAPYYRPQRLENNGAFWTAIFGNILSPGRGLLVYSPVFLFSLVGLVLKIRRRTATALDACIVACIGLHWTAISMFDIWWGGASYGPRLFSDMIPLMIYLMLPAIAGIGSGGNGTRWHVARVAFALSIALCVFMQYRGASSLAPWQWNHDPNEINGHPGRLWDWRDPPFLRR
jgi:hypothetical protein